MSFSKRSFIKICERCFLCHSVVLCPFCNKCKRCCFRSSCRGKTSKLLAGLAGSGFRSESGTNFERGLHPSLSDPTKVGKTPHSHKLLWQSSQEQLPVRGITSAYGQKCCRTSTQPDLSRVFQPTVFGPQTQQQMEANIGPEPVKSFSQSGEIQDGNTGNHQNILPTRGVGHVSRFQRCLLPCPNTGTVQEISQISYTGSDIPIQSLAFWSVHSTHGVHCISKGGEADGRSQGYKNPPVPRRLVSKGQIIPHLSPTYTKLGKNVSSTGLAGEHRQIGAGAEASFQLCRLPVRPQVQPGQADTGPVAKPPGQNTYSFSNAGLSGLTDSNREASSSWLSSHEAHSVAPQKQLEDTGISGDGYPSTQVPAPTLAMVARGKQCAARSTITPGKTCSANIYRRIKRRVGRSLKRAHCKRVLVSAGKPSTHKLSGVKSSVSRLERVPRALCRQDSASCNRQYNGSSLHKQGRGYEIGPTVWRILTWCSQRQVTLKARHIPGHLNVIADKLSRLGQTIQTEWSLLPKIFQRICNRWHRPQIDLFATRFNHKLPRFVSPVPDPLAVAVDALTLPWEDLDAYAFPPTAI